MSVDPVLPRTMTLDEFAPLVGQWFDADCSPRTASLLLVSAKPLPHLGQGLRRPFRLLFRSGPNTLLVTGNYTMRCGAFGPDLIHIAATSAPLGADRAAHHYQAVFN